MASKRGAPVVVESEPVPKSDKDDRFCPSPGCRHLGTGYGQRLEWVPARLCAVYRCEVNPSSPIRPIHAHGCGGVYIAFDGLDGRRIRVSVRRQMPDRHEARQAAEECDLVAKREIEACRQRDRSRRRNEILESFEVRRKSLASVWTCRGDYGCPERAAKVLPAWQRLCAVCFAPLGHVPLRADAEKLEAARLAALAEFDKENHR